MRRLAAAASLLALLGCDRSESKEWKARFLKEIDSHYQTQQIKNAEISARDAEIASQQEFIRVQNDRDGKTIARVKLDRVEQKWSAAKIVERTDDPRKGDRAVLAPSEKPK